MKLTLAAFIFFLVASVPVFLFITVRERIDLFGNVAQLTGLVLAGVSFWQAWGRSTPAGVQATCVWVAIGSWIWAFGQVMITYSELLLHQSPYGTVSSIFFVLGNLLILAAVLSFVRRTFKRGVTEVDSRGYIFQAATIACLLTGLVLAQVWGLLTDPARNVPAKILDILYPLFDIAIAVLMIPLCRIAKRSSDRDSFKAYAFLGGAFAMVLAADMVGVDLDFDATLYRGVDVLYFSSYFLMAISGHFFARGPS